MRAGAKVREGEQGNTWLDLKLTGKIRSQEGNICQIFSRWLYIHRGISEEICTSTHDHDIYTSRDPPSGLCVMDTECWADDIGIIIRQTRNGYIGISHFDHHGSEDI